MFPADLPAYEPPCQQPTGVCASDDKLSRTSRHQQDNALSCNHDRDCDLSRNRPEPLLSAQAIVTTGNLLPLTDSKTSPFEESRRFSIARDVPQQNGFNARPHDLPAYPDEQASAQSTSQHQWTTGKKILDGTEDLNSTSSAAVGPSMSAPQVLPLENRIATIERRRTRGPRPPLSASPNLSAQIVETRVIFDCTPRFPAVTAPAVSESPPSNMTAAEKGERDLYSSPRARTLIKL